MSWIGNRASGKLHVGTTFTQADRSALASAGDTYAVLVSDTLAGRGAGELELRRRGSIASLKGTDYYACGTIGITGTVTFGRRDARGVASLTGRGTLTGGTGNYKDIRGDFTLEGSYSTKTRRAAFVLKGTATF